MSFASDIELAAGSEEIEHVVIGAFGWGSFGESDVEAYGFREGRHPVPQAHKGVVLQWADARNYLAYTYDSGYGAPDCHAIYAWTATRVILVSTYDGSTYVTWIPRHPIECEPEMFGG